MKPKPVPKKELVVEFISTQGGLLQIYTKSIGAANFVESYCTRLGVLRKVLPQIYQLHVRPLYDPEEVKAYIESYNDPA